MKLLLITGLPASGKSTLARRLSQRYGLPLIAKDCIKEPLLDVLGAETPAQSRKLSDASFAVMFALARELVHARTSFILEGNFRPGEHEAALLTVIGAKSQTRSPVVQAAGAFPSKDSAARSDCGSALDEERAFACGMAGADSGMVCLAQVLCRIDEAQRLERLAARSSDRARHPGHRDVHLINATGQASDAFLSLPGERVLYEGDESKLIPLEAWWRAPD